MGSSAGFPGWDGRVPSTAGTIAEILRDNGYNTFARLGNVAASTPDEEGTDAGPFDHWPTGKGFDHFFGFLGSATDQYKPDLVEDQAHVTPDGRHLSEQITDKAIFFIDRQKKAAPDKPFFLYYAPAATHAPHMVDKYWSDQYKGKFDKGWDVYRQEVFDRQKKLGVIPANAILPDRNPNVKAWDSLTTDEKKLYARFMEVYAGYLTFTDFEVGRLVNHIKELGQLDNTLIFISIGDNGASKGGGSLERAIDRSASPFQPSHRGREHRLQPRQDRQDRYARKQKWQLSAGLGTGVRHPVQALEIGCQQRRRNPQSPHRLLAEGY